MPFGNVPHKRGGEKRTRGRIWDVLLELQKERYPYVPPAEENWLTEDETAETQKEETDVQPSQ